MWAVALAALALGGCGKRAATPAQASLEREDLIAVLAALRGTQGRVDEEVAAAKAAWPYVLDGLNGTPSGTARSHIEAAWQAASRLPLPTLLAEREPRSPLGPGEAAALTGPGSPLAGRYRDFAGLSAMSWRMIAAALQQIRSGTPAAASFARANVALYIEGVYDAHASLAETGKEILGAYQALGGERVFGSSLRAREVSSLAQAYSRARDELYPHERVRLGS